MRVRACRPSLPSGVVEDSADVVEHLTHDDAAVDHLVAGRVDVVRDEDQALG